MAVFLCFSLLTCSILCLDYEFLKQMTHNNILDICCCSLKC